MTTPEVNHQPPAPPKPTPVLDLLATGIFVTIGLGLTVAWVWGLAQLPGLIGWWPAQGAYALLTVLAVYMFWRVGSTKP